MIHYGVQRRRDAILSPEFEVRRHGPAAGPRIGVLALQGDFREHRAILESLGAVTSEVRRAAQLDALHGLVIPGGESTTIGKLMREYGFIAAIRAFAAAGGAIYGSCAGLIALASRIVEGDQPLLGLIDITARRNAFGRQVRSFEADLDVPWIGPEPMRAVFIRAPWIEDAAAGVEILATCQGHGVAARQGKVLVTAFHPELTGDTRVHASFIQMASAHDPCKNGPIAATPRAAQEVVS